MKPSGQSSSQARGDCGVWLDTVQLKGKAKKRRLARPISKLLNPFTKGEGYNVAVALNFTQTKMEMPKTKQSSLSNFFTCQRRVLNKMSTTEAPNTDAQDPCQISTLTLSKTGAKTNHKEDLGIWDSENQPLWFDVDFSQRQQNMTKPEDEMKREKEDFASQNIYKYPKEDERSPPKSKRRISGAAFSSNICKKPGQYSQDSEGITCSQKSTSENLHDFESSSLLTQNTFNTFGSLPNAEGTRTSTQKSTKDTFSQMDTPKFPKKSVSHIQPQSKHSKNLVSPQKCPSNKTDRQDDHFNSQYTFRKPNISPLKKQKWPPLKDSDEESLAMLFTQDSEGFRVIAHRCLQARSPLKDQSNVSPSITERSDVTCIEDYDDEEDMLFTQDSQGNMVIKH